MHYIPNDEEEDYIERRNLIYEFCSFVWKDVMTEKKDGTNFPKEQWDKIDNTVIKKIIEDIEKEEKLGRKYTIDFTQKFVEFIIKNYHNFVDKNIFPNQNGVFFSLYNLYEDNNIPNQFKDCLKSYCNVDIRENLLDSRLNSLDLRIPKRKIYDYKDILKQKFQQKKENYVSYQLKEAAICLLKIIPEKDNENTDIEDVQNKQRQLFFLYEIFKKEKFMYC